MVFNAESIDFFFPASVELGLQVLLIEADDLAVIRDYQEEPDYIFSINSAIIKYFPDLVFKSPGYASQKAFEAEQNLMEAAVAKLAKGNQDMPKTWFNVKYIEVSHVMQQDLHLRRIFNSLSISDDVQFVKHVFRQKNAMFVATKCLKKENPDIYQMSHDSEQVIFGAAKGDVLRVFKNGRLLLRHVVNQVLQTDNWEEYVLRATQRLQYMVELINSVAPDATALEIQPQRLNYYISAGIYISYERV